MYVCLISKQRVTECKNGVRVFGVKACGRSVPFCFRGVLQIKVKAQVKRWKGSVGESL